MINRRTLLKWILTTPLALTMDVEKLLWIPNQQIFISGQFRGITEAQIVAAELERILPHIRTLFERDDTFYSAISKKSVPLVSSRPMRIPLIMEPGKSFMRLGPIEIPEGY